MASHFPPAWMDELRARSDIVQTVSGYVSLKKNGKKYWGLCPFHGEKTASFSVDPEMQLYYCFGCKAGGTVFTFIMEMERLTFPEAVELLAERAHMPMPQMIQDEDYERRRSQRERLLSANREAARFFHDSHCSFLNAALLRSRGSRIRLRMRRLWGVTSRSSSQSIYSIACSRDRILGGVSFRASSALDDRVLVRCLVLQTFSSISSVFPFCPMTIPL